MTTGHCKGVIRGMIIAAIVAVSLGAPIVEMFDRWDQTAADGNDTEANVVIAALCAGVAFTLGTVVVTRCMQALASTFAGRNVVTAIAVRDLSLVLPFSPDGSPPTVLRV